MDVKRRLQKFLDNEHFFNDHVLEDMEKDFKIGKGIPSKYNQPPWRLLKDGDFGIKSNDTVEKINKILNINIKIQASKLYVSWMKNPETVEEIGKFTNSDKEEVLKNIQENKLRLSSWVNSAIFPGIVRHCIGLILEEGDKMPEIYVRRILCSQEDVKIMRCDAISTPWLKFNNTPITVHHPADNSYDLLVDYVTCKEHEYLEHFKRELDAGGARKPLVVRPVQFQGIPIMEYATYPSVEKFIVYLLNTHNKLFLKFFIKKVNEHLQSELGIRFDDKDIQAKWKNLCWKCLKAQKEEENALKQCSICKLARYCDRNCQKADWEHHKKLHLIEEKETKMCNKN